MHWEQTLGLMSAVIGRMTGACVCLARREREKHDNVCVTPKNLWLPHSLREGFYQKKYAQSEG